MKKLTTLMMILAITLLGSDKITELKNTQTEIIVQVDTAYRMGDADSKQSAKKQVLEKAKILASEYAGTYVESNVELVNGKLTKNEVSTLSRAFVSQSITKEQFKMLDNGFMILEATVQSTINKKGMLDKLETISQSKENKNKIAQIQQSNEKLQEELLQVNNELSSLKNSTAALAQKLLAKRETIYKELDANDNVVLTKLNKAEVLSQAVQTKQAYDKYMDEFKCKVNSNLYILEKILTPKVKSTKLDFDGESYSLKVVVQLGDNLKYLDKGLRPRNRINLRDFARFFGIGFYSRSGEGGFNIFTESFNKSEEIKNQKFSYVGGKTLDLNIILNDKKYLTNRLASYYKDEYGVGFATNSDWKDEMNFLTKEFHLKGLTAEDVTHLETISLQLKGYYEHSSCLESRFNDIQNLDNYKLYKGLPNSRTPIPSSLSDHLKELIENYVNLGLDRDLKGKKIARDEYIELSLKVLNDLSKDALRDIKRNLTKKVSMPDTSELKKDEVEGFLAQIDQLILYEKWRIEKVSGKNVYEREYLFSSWSAADTWIGNTNRSQSYSNKSFSMPFF